MPHLRTVTKILHSIAFVFIYAFVYTTPSIPFSAYQTFVIEEKHGFNKTTVGTFIADILKAWFLSLAIGAPFLSAFLWIFRFAGDHFVPYLMAFMWVILLLPMI
jgi:STE24 endopeptidase